MARYSRHRCWSNTTANATLLVTRAEEAIMLQLIKPTSAWRLTITLDGSIHMAIDRCNGEHDVIGWQSRSIVNKGHILCGDGVRPMPQPPTYICTGMQAPWHRGHMRILYSSCRKEWLLILLRAKIHSQFPQASIPDIEDQIEDLICS